MAELKNGSPRDEFSVPLSSHEESYQFSVHDILGMCVQLFVSLSATVEWVR